MTWPRRGSERAIALAKRRCRARAGALRAPIHIDRHILNYDLPWNPMRLGVLWLQVADFGGAAMDPVLPPLQAHEPQAFQVRQPEQVLARTR